MNPKNIKIIQKGNEYVAFRYRDFLCIEATINVAFMCDAIGGTICCHCNSRCEDKGTSVFYVSVLNDLMCQSCFEEYINSARYYVEDSPIEFRNFRYMFNHIDFTDKSISHLPSSKLLLKTPVEASDLPSKTILDKMRKMLRI